MKSNLKKIDELAKKIVKLEALTPTEQKFINGLNKKDGKYLSDKLKEIVLEPTNPFRLYFGRYEKKQEEQEARSRVRNEITGMVIFVLAICVITGGNIEVINTFYLVLLFVWTHWLMMWLLLGGLDG